MGDLITGYSWADGQTAMPVRFNQAINDAVLTPAALSGKTENTNPALDSLLLLHDSADTLLKKLTLANFLKAAIHNQSEKTSLVDADEFLVYDSAASAAKKVLLANILAVGSVLQSKSAEITDASTSYSTVIPVDDTIPQIGEGVQILSVTITPRFSNSLIRIRLNGTCTSTSGTIFMSAAVFRNSVANAIGGTSVCNPGINLPTALTLEFDDAPATTSATTYTVRIGPQAGGFAMKINGGGTRLIGGVARTSIVVEEIKQ